MGIQRQRGGFENAKGYIPHDGVVLSPSVEIFRAGTETGYAFMEEPLRLAAANGLGTYSCDSEALATRTSTLVMPDFGRALYRDDSHIVGRIFGELLRTEFWGHLQGVVLVGGEEFKASVQAAVQAPQRGRPPIPQLPNEQALVERARSLAAMQARIVSPNSGSKKVAPP